MFGMEIEEETLMALRVQYASDPMFYAPESSSGSKAYCSRLKERSAEYFQTHPDLLKMISEETDEDPSSTTSSSEDYSSGEDDSYDSSSESESDYEEMVDEIRLHGSSKDDCIVIEDTIDDLVAFQEKVFSETDHRCTNEEQYDDIKNMICDKYTIWMNEIARDRMDVICRLSLPQSPLKDLEGDEDMSTAEGTQIIEKLLNEIYASFKTPTLQAWQMDKVREIKEAAHKKSGKVLSNVGSYALSGAEFFTLLPSRWLNDEIINSYFELIANRSEKLAKVFKAGIPRCIMLNSFFYAKLNCRGGYDYSRVSRWTRKYTDLFGYDKILIPINQPNHWVLVVINFAKKTVEYYDSLFGEDSTCANYILRWLGDEWADKYKTNPKYKDCNPRVSGWSIVYPKDIPRQRNGYDCGVFTCKNAECLSRSDSINFTQKETPHIREVMMYELYKGKLLLDPTDISSKYI